MKRWWTGDQKSGETEWNHTVANAEPRGVTNVLCKNKWFKWERCVGKNARIGWLFNLKNTDEKNNQQCVISIFSSFESLPRDFQRKRQHYTTPTPYILSFQTVRMCPYGGYYHFYILGFFYIKALGCVPGCKSVCLSAGVLERESGSQEIVSQLLTLTLIRISLH